MKSLLALPVLAWISCGIAWAEWTAPKNPEPQKILTEAREDSEAGRYEDALAKYMWFHMNALRYDQSLYGVRLSFALAGWARLGAVYPPALTAMKATRDEVSQEVREDRFSSVGVHVFNEFAALNRYLGDDAKTTETFLWLNTHREEAAKRDYPAAEPALIKSKEYQMIGKYIQADVEFADLRKNFQQQKELANDPAFGERVREMAEKDFSKRVATLVAVLVINKRPADAERIATEAKKDWTSESFEGLLKTALGGGVPAD